MFIVHLFLLICSTLFLLVKCTDQRGFLIVAPSIFLEETIENVCISLHNTSASVTVNIGFHSVEFQQKIWSHTYNVSDSNAGCIQVYLPPLGLETARFVVQVMSTTDPEISGNIESMVTVQKKQLVTLLVTDKPIYKPGQEVRFRILSLSHSLKPENIVSKVWVEDPSSTRISEWNDLTTEHGLVELKFSLDEHSLQGAWNIYVEQNNHAPQAKTFNVLEYVAPKFEIIITPPSRISADTKVISWGICAKYSYGRIVRGRLFLQVKLMKQSTFIPPQINDSGQLNDKTGCFNYSLSSSELNLSNQDDMADTISFVATVEEEGTGIALNSTVISKISHTVFFLRFQCSSYFKPGLPYKGTIKLMTEGEGDVSAGKKIQICVKLLHKGSMALRSLGCWSYTSDLGSQVVFTLPVLMKPQDVQMIMLVASAPDYPTKQYANSSQILMIGPTASQTIRPWFSPSSSYLDASTRAPIHCSSTHMIPVRYTVTNKSEPTPLFHYLVKSRGDLLVLHSIFPKAETLLQNNNVETEGNIFVRSWRLPLRITPKMAPISKLTIYYVRSDGEVVATTTPLIIEPCFPNKVRIHWSTIEAAPSSTVSLRVRAHPQSLCGISVVDQSLYSNTPDTSSIEKNLWSYLEAFDYPIETRNSKNHCKRKADESRQFEYLRTKRFLLQQEKSYYADAVSAFDELGVIVLSNLVLETRPCGITKNLFTQEEQPERCYKCSEVDNPEQISTYLVRHSTNPYKRAGTVRHFFPESWIWDLVYTGNRGEVVIQTQVPHSITSWRSNVICISDREGFGLAVAAPLITFLPFFIQFDTPYSLKRNEVAQIKLSVYNYMPYDLPVRLDISSSDHFLKLDKSTIDICVKVKSLSVQAISIKALTLGSFNLTAAAIVIPGIKDCGPLDSSFIKDYVVKKILVQPEGFPVNHMQSSLLCTSEESGRNIVWDLTMADNVVADSLRAEVNVVADLLGPALQNLNSLVELPTGCGEQSIVQLACNVFVLRYIDSMALNVSALRSKALENIHKGYQRIMKFKHSSNEGFSAFGDKDPTPSIWLTAFAIKTLEGARDLTFIDKNMINDSLQWITRSQLENGCFPKIGEVFHGSMQGDSAEDGTTVALTSMVLLGLHAARFPTSSSILDNAKFCLIAGITSNDSYSLALSALALSKLNFTDKAQLALKQLMTLAENDDYFLFWQKPGESLALSIETTSYGILSLLAVGGDENLRQAYKAMKWILKNRNSKGGFVSTLDTVVALEALTMYALTLPQTQNTDLSILVTGQEIETSFRVNNDNKRILQSYILPVIPPRLEVAVQGEGCVVVQNIMAYNIDLVEDSEVFSVDITSSATTVDTCNIQRLKICLQYKLPNQSSNMAVLSVMFVSGYKPLKNLLSGISSGNVENIGGVKQWEEEDDKIIFYLNKITSHIICIDLVMERMLVVENPAPASITLTDYYHPERKVSKMYKFMCSDSLAVDSLSLNFQQDPFINDEPFSNFHNVDHELATPEGVEGPVPAYASPPQNTNSSKL